MRTCCCNFLCNVSSGRASMKLGAALAPQNIFDFFKNYIFVFEVFKNFEIFLNYR